MIPHANKRHVLRFDACASRFQVGGALPDELDGKIRFAGVHLFGALMECTTTWLAGDLPINKAELIHQSVDLLLAVGNHVLPATQPLKA